MIWVGEDEETFDSIYEPLDGVDTNEERSALGSTVQDSNPPAADGLWRPGN